MKKVVLVLVCSIIIIVFIALNYLLWDRENNIKNFESLNADKSASIDALGREIKNLGSANADLNKKLMELEDKNKSLNDIKIKTEIEKQQNKDQLEYKDDVIFLLKQFADLKPFEGIIKKWVESVDKGQYEAAFQLQLDQPLEDSQNANLNEFTNKYKNSIKSIKFKSLKLVAEDNLGAKRGDLIFKVVLEVKKAANDSSNTFADGQNERYFTINYGKIKKDWIISNISSSN